MKDLRLSIEIGRPVREVFDFTLNPKNTPKWIDFITEENTNEWPAKLGTIYRNKGASGKDWSEFELTEYDPAKSFTLSKKDGSYSVRYLFTPISSSNTRLDYYEWTDGDELTVPFTLEPLQKLKQLLEDSQSG